MIAVQVKLSVPEELASLEVCISSSCAGADKVVARRLLGPQYTFSSSTNVDTTGKQVISLEMYQGMIKKESLRMLGLG
jgi:hypothetical protein